MTTVTDRREIRRRRILENSQDRINKILNIQSQKSQNFPKNTVMLTHQDIRRNTKIDKLELETFNQNEETNINNPTSNHNEPMIQQTYIFDRNVNAAKDSKFTDFEDILENHQSKQSTLKDKPQFLLMHQGFIIFLAFFIRYLCLVSEQYGYVISMDTFETYLNKIFMPILIYETVTYVYFRQVIKDKSFLTMILLMGSRKIPNLQIFVTYLYHFHCIFQDLMLYFFSFVIFDITINIIMQGGNYME